MKTLNLYIIASLFYTTGLAQDNATTATTLPSDAMLASNVVGTWTHVSSTYPSGDVTTYQRQFQFFRDGSGVCTRYTDLDTIHIQFQWEVKDSVISLFEIRKNGKRTYADSQVISFAGLSKMYLMDAYCEDQTGKVSCYRKVESEIAKY